MLVDADSETRDEEPHESRDAAEIPSAPSSVGSAGPSSFDAAACGMSSRGQGFDSNKLDKNSAAAAIGISPAA